MESKNMRPAWWALYLLLPLVVGLLVLDAESPFSAIGHELVEIGVMLVVCGLAAHWVRANRRALLLGSRPKPTPQGGGTGRSARAITGPARNKER